MPTYIDTVLKSFDEHELFSKEIKVLDPVEGCNDPECCEPNRIINYEIKEFLKSSLEHFAQMVEKEVLVSNGYGYLDEYADKEDAIKLDLIEFQKAKLKSLLTPTTKEE